MTKNNNIENSLDSLENSADMNNKLEGKFEEIEKLFEKYKAIEIKNIDEDGNVNIIGYSPSYNFMKGGNNDTFKNPFLLLNKVICIDTYGLFFYMEKNKEGEITYFGEFDANSCTPHINENTIIKGFKTYKEFNKYRNLGNMISFHNNKLNIKY